MRLRRRFKFERRVESVCRFFLLMVEKDRAHPVAEKISEGNLKKSKVGVFS